MMWRLALFAYLVFVLGPICVATERNKSCFFCVYYTYPRCNAQKSEEKCRELPTDIQKSYVWKKNGVTILFQTAVGFPLKTNVLAHMSTIA